MEKIHLSLDDLSSRKFKSYLFKIKREFIYLNGVHLLLKLPNNKKEIHSNEMGFFFC